MNFTVVIEHCNDPKFLNREVCANSADPDKTVPSDQTPVRSGSTLSTHSVSIIWALYSMVNPHCSIFRIITSIFGCPNFFDFYGMFK